jgi:muramidase (phage lysozyme)
MKPQTFSYTMAALLVLGLFGGARASNGSEAMDQLLGGNGSGTKDAASPDVPAPAVAPEDPGYAQSGDSRGLSVNVAAFLDVIAFSELKNCGLKEDPEKGYNVMLGCKPFSGYSEHPNQVRKAGRWSSTAAGRYQFLYKSWKPIQQALGLKDFSPDSQDKAAVEIIRLSGAADLVANASSYNSFARAIKKLGPIWSSFPGSPNGQRGKGSPSMAELWSKFQESHTQYK